MNNRKQLVPMIMAIFLLGLGSRFLLAYQPADPPPLSSATGAARTNHLDTWPTLRHDPGHSGFNAAVGSFRPPLVPLDAFQLQDVSGDPHQIFSLVTGPHRIYAMGQRDIWGVNKEDPSDQWHNDGCSTNLATYYCFINFMAYSSDRLVVLRQTYYLDPFRLDNELLVLHAGTGLEDWRLSLGPDAPLVAMEGSDILLLTGSTAEARLARRTLTGNLLFEETADASGFPGSNAVVSAGRFIYANDDRILAYRTDNGQPAWPPYAPTLHGNNQSYDLVASGDSIFISQDDRVIRLNATNGAFGWETDIGVASCDTSIRSNTAATDGVTLVAAGVCDEQVVWLDVATGAINWRKSVGLVASPSAIAIGGDVLYVAAVAAPDFTIYAFDLETSDALGTIQLEATESSSVLVISDGLLLTASDLGSRWINRYERTPADLAATLSTAALPACGAAVGGVISYNFTVTNNGEGATDNTRADLILPDGAATLATSKGSCTGGASPYCDLGPLSKSEQVHITATVVLTRAGSYSPGISVSGDVRDPDDTNDSAGQPLSVAPAPPPNFDLRLTDIEVTQGVQNLANEVPLVAGKATFVRLFGKSNSGSVQNVTARLHGQVIAGGEDLGTLEPVQATDCLVIDSDTPDRDLLADSFLFELPDTWLTGGVTFTAEINPSGAIPDSTPANDTLTLATGYTRLPHVCLMTYPVRTTGKRPGSSVKTDNLFPDAMAIASDTGNILSRALTMLPVDRITVFASSHLIEEWEPFEDGGWGPYEMFKSDDNRGDVLDTLWWLNLFTDDPDICDASDSRTHYVGMIHPGTENDVGSAGLGIRDGDELTLFLNSGPNGPQAFDDPHGGLTLAHEVGHNYDRGHVNCGKVKDPDPGYPKDRDRCNFAPIDPRGYYGLEFRDPTSPTVITPTMAGDVMSYASDVWVSEYTWEAIQDKLCDASGCNLPRSSSSSGSADAIDGGISGDVLVARGQISPTIAMGNVFRLPAIEVPKAVALYQQQVASRQPALYAFNLVSGTTILHSEPFTPTESSDSETSRLTFGLVLPWNPLTTRVELTEDGVTVYSQTVSASAPLLTAISPNGGETFSDTLTVSWSATDPDGDDLRYTVLYSGDAGGSWHALASGVETTTLTVDSTLLPGGVNLGLVKVIASDGLNVAILSSASPFTLPDRQPTPFIYFPNDGGEYPSGSSLTLRGAAYDPEEGYLPASSLSWSLSGQGALGVGDHITLDGLADGDYILTLSARSASGQTGSEEIPFTVGKSGGLYLPLLSAP